MKLCTVKNLILAAVIVGITSPVYAESLFRINVSDNIYPNQPRSLYSSVKAKNIGDLVTILVNETSSISDDLKLSVKKSSSTTDNFSGTLNKIIPQSIKKLFPTDEVPNVDNFGGGTSVGNSASISRKTNMTQTIMAQVVQVLPNGNLVVQGKKSAINAGERVDMIVSGIVDPRLISSTGTIDSSKVANLQVAVTGKGTISRSDNDGTMNKIIRYFY